MTVKRTYRIVVGLDFSDMNDVVLETAFDTASRHEVPELHIVSVIEPPSRLRKHSVPDHGMALEELETRLRGAVGEKLNDFDRSFDDLKGWAVALHSRLGNIPEQIVDLAWEAEASMIIVGRHSGPVRRFSKIGNVPKTLLELTRCPVLVVQATDYGTYEDLDEQRARQCPECVAARRDSAGASWFCDQHRDYKVSRRVYMAHSSTSWPIGGGPML